MADLSLEEISCSLSPTAAEIFRASAVSFLSGLNVSEDALEVNHTHLGNIANGDYYYHLARGIITELESELMFVGAIPYPAPALNSRFEMDREVVFIDGGPQTGVTYTHEFANYGPDYIEVNLGGGHDEFHVSSLSRRMYDIEMIVASLEGFRKFLEAGVKGFREANPFIPLNGDLGKGDLVYCIRYAEQAFPGYYEAMKPLGSVVDPADRIGVIEDIDEEEDGRNTYTIKTVSGNWVRYRPLIIEHGTLKREGDDFMDELHIVGKGGFWTEDDLKRPFMTHSEAEDVILPILMRHSYDPRTEGVYTNRNQRLAEQFSLFITRGANPQRIVEIYNEQYGVPLDDIAKIAGIQLRQLAPSVNPSVSRLLEMANIYNGYAKSLLDEVSGVIGITPEEIIGHAGEFDFSQPRKIRATVEGKEVVGYVDPDSLLEHGREWYVNVYDDMIHPRSLTTVPFNGAESFGIEGYTQAISFFEVERIYEFLRHQADEIGSDRPELEKKAVEAREALEDRMEEVRRDFLGDPSDDRPREPVEPSETYSHFKGGVDSDLVAPLLYYGYTPDEAREYIMTETNNHPLFVRALDDIFEYRERLERSRIFETNHTARRMLNTVVASGATDFHEIFVITDSIMGSARDGDRDVLQTAANILRATALEGGVGVPGAAINDMLAEKRTGRMPEYLKPSDVARMVGANMLSGGQEVDNVAALTEAGHKSLEPGMVIVEGPEPSGLEDGKSYLELKITDSRVDMTRCAVMILDGLYKRNADDPRNTEYGGWMGYYPQEQRVKSIETGPRVFPVPGSNYFIVVQLEHEQDNRGRRRFDVRLDPASIHPRNEKVHYEIQPDVDSEIRKMRDAGIPVKEGGVHTIEPAEEGGYFLIPEFELPDKDNSLMTLYVYDNLSHNSIRDRKMRRRHYRHMNRDILGDKLFFSEINGRYASIVCHNCEYFGMERIIDLFDEVKQSIERSFGFQPDNILAYAQRVRRHELSAPAPLMIESKE